MTTIQAGSTSPQQKSPHERTANTVSILTNLVLTDRFEAQNDGKEESVKKESIVSGKYVFMEEKAQTMTMIQRIQSSS
jgi:hypothetical protein